MQIFDDVNLYHAIYIDFMYELYDICMCMNKTVMFYIKFLSRITLVKQLK